MPAATPTTRRAKPPATELARRNDLAEEILRLDRKTKPFEDRRTTIANELKASATKYGEPFKLELAGLGAVAVAPAAAAEFKGEVPIVVTEKWLDLSALERKRMVKSGLVKIERQFGKASNGRVNVDLVDEKAAKA